VFTQHYDIQASDIANIQRYQELKLKSSRTPSEETELSNLTTTLREKIISPDDFNKLQDCIINLENFFLTETVDYLNTKQSEFNAELGKFTYIAEFNPSTTYLKKNIVSYNGESFICQIDNTLNISPTNGTSNANWALIAMRGANGAQGAKGDAGANLVFRGAYDPTYNYQVNDGVQYNGSTYYCKTPALGVPPDNTSNWTLFVSKGASYTLTTLKNTVTVTNDTVNVPIGIAQYNRSSDVLFVYVNSTYAEEGRDYNINANNTSIDKIGGSFTGNPNTEINFVVLKNAQQSITLADGTQIMDNSVSNAKLMPDAKVGSLAALTTTAKSDVVSAVNELKSAINTNTTNISTNTTNITANTNKINNIEILTLMGVY
jgi:hypothetical protein